jgi:hypothetical protein
MSMDAINTELGMKFESSTKTTRATSSETEESILQGEMRHGHVWPEATSSKVVEGLRTEAEADESEEATGVRMS